jgi:hypothetical protein
MGRVARQALLCSSGKRCLLVVTRSLTLHTPCRQNPQQKIHTVCESFRMTRAIMLQLCLIRLLLKRLALP